MRTLAIAIVCTLLSGALYSQAKLLKDINPNPIGSGAENELTVCNGLIFFIGFHPELGYELWRTDGTEDGTFLVKDIREGADSSFPSNCFALGDWLYFNASDGQDVWLWKSDGTLEGTTQVHAVGGNYFTNVNGTLFFAAATEEFGTELWKSDGTSEGTVLVKDIYPGTRGSELSKLVASGQYCYFTAFEEENGVELWRSDGTPEGTILVKDIHPGFNGVCIYSIEPYKNGVFFDACTGTEYGIWKTDGTEEGTVFVKQLDVAFPYDFKVNDSILYFQANAVSSGVELYRSDGTEEGTFLVKDINSGMDNSYPEFLTTANGKIFFFSNYEGSKTGLYVSDGTEGGTQLIHGIPYTDSVSVTKFIISDKDKVYFFTNDDLGINIWESDGTESGTKAVTMESSIVTMESFAVVGSKLIFHGNTSETGIELYSQDLTVITDISNEQVFDFELYPNPAHDWLVLSSPGEKSVEIIDPTGVKLFKDYALDGPMRVNVENFREGVYVVRVKTKSAITHKRFIKKN